MICEAVHCFDTATVRFAIYPDGLDGPRILGEIAEDALRDVLQRGPDSLMEACERHFELIAAVALQRHHLAPRRAVNLKRWTLPNPVAITEPLGI